MNSTAQRITVAIVGSMALWLCSLSILDVSHNGAIRNPRIGMTILWTLLSLIVATGALALTRPSRKTTLASFAASSLGLLFALLSGCV
jgi:hypothetical protein